MVSFKTYILAFVLAQASATNLRGEDGTQIIGGEEVEPNVYPWFARATLGSDWAGCGGSLVTPEYVLTAAHCVEGRINQLKSNGGYQIGALCSPYGPSSSSNCQQEVESFGISDIIVHPTYGDSSSLDNDFALVRLDGASTITPVQMDQGDVSPEYENMSSKTNLWPVGFGTMDNGSVSNKLMHVNVNYVKQSECKSQYSSSSITDNMMCAADRGQDSCQGDSGGPLFDSDSNTLVGVVSWGRGCAQANYAGVYARISNQFSWIEETICSAHGDPKPAFCGNDSCVDDPEKWHDSDGDDYDCEWYAKGTNCEDYGDNFENFGKTANEACCACGGGKDGTISDDDENDDDVDECPEGSALLLVEVVTDANGSVDNKFVVKKKNLNGKFRVKVWVEEDFEDSATEIYEMCLPVDECYKFFMFDSRLDGMCCDAGEGGYKVTWDGSLIKDTLSNLSFDSGKRSKTPAFGTCE